MAMVPSEKSKKHILICLFLIYLLAGCVSCRQWRTVTRVIDGDTIILDGGERVRLLDVDTPESVHPGKPVEPGALEASAFTRELCEGKQVWLEYGRCRTDIYGRTLAYVHLADGRVLNSEIVRAGHGK